MVGRGGRKVFVIGVGMTKFVKPGQLDYPEMAKEAVLKALDDADLSYDAVEEAAVGYVYGDSTCGQRALYEVGLTGIPIVNVNNNCATGSSALYLMRNAIAGGLRECALALGFEKMQRGSLSQMFSDRAAPVNKTAEVIFGEFDIEGGPATAQFFGNAGREHMNKYGSKPEHFARIAEKNHRHSAENPNSQFRNVYTLEQILSSPMVHAPLNKLACCPTSDGAAAAILCSEDFIRRHAIHQNRAVEILALELATDPVSSFSQSSAIKAVGFDMTKLATERVFAQVSASIRDVDVIELHDCFATNELITYEALGLCGVGEGHLVVERGDNTYGGRWVVNPSGGLISKGHPLGATGIAQCAELCWHLRDEAGPRQVANARLALSHNIGLGGAVVVGLYRKAQLSKSSL